MSVSYEPLWHKLISKGLRKMEFIEKVGISAPTLAKLGKNEYVAMEVIDKICQYFGCRIEDVVEITLDEVRPEATETE